MWTLGCSQHTGSPSVTGNKNLSVKVRSNGQQKRATCLATLLQNEFNGDDARFTSRVEAYLAVIQVIAGCKNLLQKVESGPFFATKSLLVARFTGLKQTRFEPSEANAAFCAKRETRRGEKNKAFFFLLSSFRAARKMPRSPRLAHKEPVMQAILQQVT